MQSCEDLCLLTSSLQLETWRNHLWSATLPSRALPATSLFPDEISSEFLYETIENYLVQKTPIPESAANPDLIEAAPAIPSTNVCAISGASFTVPDHIIAKWANHPEFGGPLSELLADVRRQFPKRHITSPLKRKADPDQTPNGHKKFKPPTVGVVVANIETVAVESVGAKS